MADRFDLDPQRMLERVRARAEETAQRVTDAIRSHAPVYRGPDPRHEGGALRDGLKGKLQRELPDGVELATVSDQPYVRPLIDGQRPHTIEARYAGSLMFYASDGGIVFRRRVEHPGAEPNPFPHEADAEIREIVRDVMGEAARAVLRS